MPEFKNLRAVGYQTDEPYVKLSSACWDFSCPNPGAEIEFLEMTLELMNATATIIQIDADIDLSIQMVANGSADLTLVSARQTLERMKLVDFTTPIGFVYYGYLLRENPEITVADYIASIFDLDTLISLILFALLVGSLIFLYTWIFDLRTRSLFDWLIVTAAGLIRQFSFKISNPICALVIVGVWLWCCQIIVTYYEAKLKSFLLLAHHRGSFFDTLDGALDAVENRGWTMIIQDRGYTPYLWCNPEQCKRLDRLKSSIINIKSDEDLLDYLSKGNYFSFSALSSDMADTSISYYSYKNKILFVRDKLMAPEYLAYAVSKRIKGLREQFNRAVAITTDGYGTIRSRYMESFPNYFSTTEQNQNAYQLETSHFLQLYKFCLIAYGVGVIFLLAEILFIRIPIPYRSFTYKLRGWSWRFNRPKWTHFPRRSTIILPVQRNYTPQVRRRLTIT
ncbi:unnamed protein product [Caenorhabditis angaria]|uniref:Uncharacterized protein n=1 Tax=Caenorhabditis angaria TaxID=860376 RepID=A0A9P1N059_9PELO|nr:unnamed protein product [Caenorhabditis angaria]